jgi:predicted transcriptional regulator
VTHRPAIWRYLKRRPGCTRNDLQQALGLTRHNCVAALRQMHKSGHVTVTGSGKVYYWWPVAGMREPRSMRGISAKARAHLAMLNDCPRIRRMKLRNLRNLDRIKPRPALEIERCMGWGV